MKGIKDKLDKIFNLEEKLEELTETLELYKKTIEKLSVDKLSEVFLELEDLDGFEALYAVDKEALRVSLLKKLLTVDDEDIHISRIEARKVLRVLRELRDKKAFLILAKKDNYSRKDIPDLVMEQLEILKKEEPDLKREVYHTALRHLNIRFLRSFLEGFPRANWIRHLDVYLGPNGHVNILYDKEKMAKFLYGLSEILKPSTFNKRVLFPLVERVIYEDKFYEIFNLEALSSLAKSEAADLDKLSLYAYKKLEDKYEDKDKLEKKDFEVLDFFFKYSHEKMPKKLAKLFTNYLKFLKKSKRNIK